MTPYQQLIVIYLSLAYLGLIVWSVVVEPVWSGEKALRPRGVLGACVLDREQVAGGFSLSHAW